MSKHVGDTNRHV